MALLYQFWDLPIGLSSHTDLGTKSKRARMKPPPFAYHDPRTPEDVVGLLSSLDNAKLLAGGQSLMPMLNMRFVQPDHLIDLNGVEGLDFIREKNGAIEI